VAQAAEPNSEVVLDSSILIQVERRFRNLRAALAQEGLVPVVPTVVLAEIWRGSRTQANLAHALKGMLVTDCTEPIAKRAGVLLAATGRSNTVDAIVVATAESLACPVLTRDRKDIDPLAARAEGVAVL
jgi:predicted nucleic acid-binding protein